MSSEERRASDTFQDVRFVNELPPSPPTPSAVEAGLSAVPAVPPMAGSGSSGSDSRVLEQGGYARLAGQDGTGDGTGNGDAAEDDAYWRTYKWSFAVLMFLALTDAIEYGVIMPSLFTYLERMDDHSHSEQQLNHFYGIILSAFSLASLCTKPFIGYLADKRPYRETLVWSTVVAIAGNVLYFLTAFLVSKQADGQRSVFAFLLAARMLSGVGCANTSVTFAYIARTVPPSRRTRYMTFLSTGKICGLLLGPGLNAITSLMNFSVGGVAVDEYNSPGLFVALIQALLVGLLLAVLEEPPPYEQVEASRDGDELSDESDEQVRASKSSVFDVLVLMSLPLGVCFLNVAFFNFFVGTVEALVVPTTTVAFSWRAMQNSYVYLGITGVAITTSIIVLSLSSKVEDRTFMVIAGFLALVGTIGAHEFFWYDMRVPQFWWGILLWAMPISLVFPTNRSLFSRLISESHWQALLSSLLSVAASVGGAVGPIFVGLTLGKRPAHPEHLRVAPLTIWGCFAAACFVLFANVLILFVLPTKEPILGHANAKDLDDADLDDADADRDFSGDADDDVNDMRIVAA